MALLYGRAGGLTDENGGFWAGQFQMELYAFKLNFEQRASLMTERSPHELGSKVRKTPSWPRSWTNFSLF
jgi:hypothetical protein